MVHELAQGIVDLSICVIPFPGDQCNVPDDWTVSPSNEQKFYKLITTNSLFADAFIGCNKLGGRLGTFKDDEEYKLLKKMGEYFYAISAACIPFRIT